MTTSPEFVVNENVCAAVAPFIIVTKAVCAPEAVHVGDWKIAELGSRDVVGDGSAPTALAGAAPASTAPATARVPWIERAVRRRRCMLRSPASDDEWFVSSLSQTSGKGERGAGSGPRVTS